MIQGNEQDVDVDQSLYEDNPFRTYLIDTLTQPVVIFTLIFISGFIIFRFYTSAFNPESIKKRTKVVAINKSRSDNLVNVDLLLSALKPTHRLLQLKTSLIRNMSNASERQELYADVSYLTHYLKDKKIVNTDRVQNFEYNFTFAQNQQESDVSPMYKKDRIHGFDEIDIQITFTTNASNLIAVMFYWDFDNFSASRFNIISCLILTFMVVYVIFLFIYFTDFTTITYDDHLLICTGILSILITFPIGFAVSNIDSYRTFHSILCSILTVLMRIYTAIQLIKFATEKYIKFESIVAICFFSLYGIVDCYVLLTGNSIQSVILIFDIITCILYSYFIVKSLLVVVSQRNVFFCFFGLLYSILSIWYQNPYVVDTNLYRVCMRSDLWGAIHVVITVFMIFMMQNNADGGYGQINENIEVPNFVVQEESISMSDDQSES